MLKCWWSCLTRIIIKTYIKSKFPRQNIARQCGCPRIYIRLNFLRQKYRGLPRKEYGSMGTTRRPNGQRQVSSLSQFLCRIWLISRQPSPYQLPSPCENWNAWAHFRIQTSFADLAASHLHDCIVILSRGRMCKWQWLPFGTTSFLFVPDKRFRA